MFSSQANISILHTVGNINVTMRGVASDPNAARPGGPAGTFLLSGTRNGDRWGNGREIQVGESRQGNGRQTGESGGMDACKDAEYTVRGT